MKGKRIQYSASGFMTDGSIVNKDLLIEELTFEQFINKNNRVHIIGTTKHGIIQIVEAEKCKVLADENQGTLLG